MQPAAFVVLAIIAGGIGLFIFATVERRRSMRLSRRIQRIAGAGAAAQTVAVTRRPRPRRQEERHAPRLFGFLGLRMPWGVELSLVKLLLTACAAGAGVALAASAVFHLPQPVALGLGAAGFLVVPRVRIRQARRKAEAKFLELLPDAIDMIVRMVRAGLPVSAAIRTVGDQTVPPVNGVFSEMADQIEIGMTIEEVLANMGDRIGVDDFRFFVVAVVLQRSTGGNLATTLETLSEIIRRRRAVRLKANSATAEVRVSAMVLSAIPFLIFGALALLAPHYLLPLLADPRGNMILGTAALNLVLAGLIMRWIVRRGTRT